MGQLMLPIKNHFFLSSITNHLCAVIFIPDLLCSEWSQKGSGEKNKSQLTDLNWEATGSKKCFDVVKTPFGYRLPLLASAGGSNLLTSSWS